MNDVKQNINITPFVINALFCTLLFLYFYGPRLAIADIHTLMSALLCGIGALLLLKKSSINKHIIIGLLWALLFLTYNAIIFYAHGHTDASMILISIKWMLYLLSTHTIFHFYEKYYKEKFHEKIVEHLLLVSAINSLIVCLLMFSPSLKVWVFNHLNYTSQENWVTSGHRSFDLSMGGGAIASIVFALGFIFTLMNIKFTSKPYRYAGYCFLMLFAVLFTGRSGQLVIAIGILYLFLFHKFFVIKKIRNSSSKILKILVVYFSLSAIPIGYLVIVNPSALLDPLEKFIPWATEALTSITEDGNSVKSVDKIYDDMFIFPASGMQMYFGDSNLGRHQDLPYIASDIGYIRTIFASGIVGTAIYTLFFIYCLMITLKSRSLSGSFLLFISLITLIFNFKELILFHKALGAWFFFAYFLFINTPKGDKISYGGIKN